MYGRAVQVEAMAIGLLPGALGERLANLLKGVCVHSRFCTCSINLASSQLHSWHSRQTSCQVKCWLSLQSPPPPPCFSTLLAFLSVLFRNIPCMFLSPFTHSAFTVRLQTETCFKRFSGLLLHGGEEGQAGSQRVSAATSLNQFFQHPTLRRKE